MRSRRSAPDAVGGTVQLLSLLDAALVHGGHRSIVIGCDGAFTAGRLVSVPGACPVLDDAEWWRAERREQRRARAREDRRRQAWRIHATDPAR